MKPLRVESEKDNFRVLEIIFRNPALPLVTLAGPDRAWSPFRDHFIAFSLVPFWGKDSFEIPF